MQVYHCLTCNSKIEAVNDKVIVKNYCFGCLLEQAKENLKKKKLRRLKKFNNIENK